MRRRFAIPLSLLFGFFFAARGQPLTTPPLAATIMMSTFTLHSQHVRWPECYD